MLKSYLSEKELMADGKPNWRRKGAFNRMEFRNDSMTSRKALGIGRLWWTRCKIIATPSTSKFSVSLRVHINYKVNKDASKSSNLNLFNRIGANITIKDIVHRVSFRDSSRSESKPIIWKFVTPINNSVQRGTGISPPNLSMLIRLFQYSRMGMKPNPGSIILYHFFRSLIDFLRKLCTTA